jgi:hypothetical protein
MSEHVPAILPVDYRPIEVIAPLVAQAPPATSAMPAHSAEEIRAVDRAFVTDKEQNDAIAGLVGLYLSAPWLADLIADHFRTPPDEDEDARRPRLDGPEPHEHC